MHGCCSRIVATLSLVTVLAVEAAAADVPPSWLEDAELHSVRLIGTKFAIAVGEHGAICKSIDGGRIWTTTYCGFDVSLRSVWFLDDRVGWIAGSDVSSYAGVDRGILLSTRDGGNSWQRIGEGVLPSLSYVRFHEIDEGIVVGRPTARSPSGIYKTTDGGKTWHGIPGEAPQSWKAASILGPEAGVVVGASGRVALLGSDQLRPSSLQPQGFRSIRGVSLLPNNVGWLAGDGGLVLKTSTGGVVWETPPSPLPIDLRHVMDFRTVEAREDHVWIAGSPGSVIWHSADGGKHWEQQLTGQSTPLTALQFSNDRQGIAVGSLGLILRTEDAGKTWKVVRGIDRRAAFLSLHARQGRTTAPLLAKLSGEMGYRSAVWVAQREDVGPLALSTECEPLLQAAVQRSGGNSADVCWQLPLTLPGIEFSSDQLVSAWQKQTEGRLPQTLVGTLVRQIRMWKPNLVLIDEPSPDDAVGQVLYDAAIRAIEQAPDAGRYPEQSTMTGLSPWTVDRIYVRLAAEATGDATIDLDEFLAYRKTSVRVAASQSDELLQLGRPPRSDTVEVSRIVYRRIEVDANRVSETAVPSKSSSSSVSKDFFSGLSISPGSSARRELGDYDENGLAKMQKLIQRQRNFTAIFRKSLDDPKNAGQMIGQINGIVDGMETRQAVQMLRDLADEYRKRSQFDMVESTYVALIRRYPGDAGAQDAMRWLIQFWSSSETAWQRTRLMQSNRTNNSQQGNGALESVEQASGQSTALDNNVQSAGGFRPEFNQKPRNKARTNSSGQLEFNSKPNGKDENPLARMKMSTDWRGDAVREWHTRANDLAKQLKLTSPLLYQSPVIQFPLAGMYRADGTSRAADPIWREFALNAADASTKELAERELWASVPTPQEPKGLAFCRPTNKRPYLDGVLSDPCWVSARELHLTDDDPRSQLPTQGGEDSPFAMVMLAYDNEFLYVGLSVPRAAGAPDDPAEPTGREHDADLTRHDRISIRLDLDRDYSTWYEFEIDQRGWTSEKCWEDRHWNPQWYVAAESEKERWRIEAAIPLSELAPTPPSRGSYYALSIVRTSPGVGLQSWTHPIMTQQHPSSFGLLKFE